MGNVQLGIPKALAVALINAGGLQTFVETGTWKGGTTEWATRYFGDVISIEAYEPRYKKTAAALEGKGIQANLFYGDSAILLPKILYSMVHFPTLFWLDAHFCGDYDRMVMPGLVECPILAELDAIIASPLAQQHCILIDDARYFTGPIPYPHDPKQWPGLPEIMSKLPSSYYHVAIQEDVIAAVPIALTETLKGVSQWHTQPKPS